MARDEGVPSPLTVPRSQLARWDTDSKDVLRHVTSFNKLHREYPFIFRGNMESKLHVVVSMACGTCSSLPSEDTSFGDLNPVQQSAALRIGYREWLW